ncbi:hypothetical protein DPMN_050445 [Dreissena polymorpha]|uniref:Uncharacterized protein n=1 Tax=Dreissena polymorpha TaxID=45954 RepID=A0A9D4CG51_DREPO|nr:hypothetical protein DPMN_050445 [Dreissena polymorpha]
MFLPPEYNTKELESGVKHKWRWEGLHERDSREEKWRDWLKETLRVAHIVISVSKRSSTNQMGKGAFKSHAEDVTHVKNYRTWKSHH